MNKLAISHIWVSVAFLVITASLLAVYWTTFPPQVPLWYSQPWGQDQLASPWWLILVPVLIGGMFGLGWLGTRWLIRDRLLAGLWLATAMVVELVLALGLVRIVWLIVL